MSAPRDSRTPAAIAAPTLGALGVVCGDIGPSPLYALKEVFVAGHVPVTPEYALGILSLVCSTMTVIVSIKYVLLILRADNHGEGGLIAMLALATGAVADRPRLRHAPLVVGMFGTAVFYGDGVTTPAISVLSAVEGLEVAAPALHEFVVPIALGAPQVAANPSVLAALNPAHALGFVAAEPLVALVSLGAVVPTVTGGEAPYADLGHVGRLPIRLAWYGLVMPAPVIDYFGQGALLLAQPEAVDRPFYRLAPEWARRRWCSSPPRRR